MTPINCLFNVDLYTEQTPPLLTLFMELVCPAGSLNAFKAAVENGADAIYLGFKNETNARHFAGLNFNDRAAQKALKLALEKKVKIFVAINTFANERGNPTWQKAVDAAVDLGANAIIAADISVMDYTRHRYPNQPLHLSVQASATNAKSLAFFHRHFGIQRAVLPRVLSLAQIRSLCINGPVDIEVFAFGSLCVMAEGRCYLSSYVTGESPNTVGACSPAKFVAWEPQQDIINARLNGVLIDSVAKDEQAGYPTLCKGRFQALGKRCHVLEAPTSLNTMDLLPQLHQAGVKALKIEGRQRSPAYVAKVVRVWRQALDHFQQNPTTFAIQPEWQHTLQEVSEGAQTTFGAYERQWQ